MVRGQKNILEIFKRFTLEKAEIIPTLEEGIHPLLIRNDKEQESRSNFVIWLKNRDVD
jgi:hypothetical protein